MPHSQGKMLFEGAFPGTGDRWFSGPPSGKDWRIRGIFVSKATTTATFIDVGVGVSPNAVAFWSNIANQSLPAAWVPVNIYVPNGHTMYSFVSTMAASPRIYITGEEISFP